MFVQSALLAALGIASGMLIAPLGVRTLLSILPPDIPRAASIRVDAPVLGITVVVAMLATLAFGTVAAFRGRVGARLSLRADAAGDQRSTARSGALRTVDLGFSPGGVTVARIALPDDRYGSELSQTLFFDRLLARVRVKPGVAAAGLVSIRPLGGLGPATTIIDRRIRRRPGRLRRSSTCASRTRRHFARCAFLSCQGRCSIRPAELERQRRLSRAASHGLSGRTATPSDGR